MGQMIEQNIFAILTAIASFVSAFTIIKVKVEQLEKRLTDTERLSSECKSTIERRNEEMRSINRRLDQIDDLKIEANLVEIKTELSHIRILIEKNS